MKAFTEIKNFLTGNKAKEEESKILTPEIFKRKQMYETVMNTRHFVGVKEFCFIPLELLEIDDSYQRLNCINKEKIYSLVNHFDQNKCDPIQVSPHPETYTFAVTNGVHRMMCAQIRKESGIEACIMTGLSSDPEQRRIQEAALFATQTDQVDNLSASQKHNANVVRGIKKYVVLDECIKERKLVVDCKLIRNLPKEKQDEMADYRVLTGYTAALATAGLVDGKAILTNILDIIEKSAWRNSACGYSVDVIRTLQSILIMHNNDNKIINAIIDYFVHIEPKEFMAQAYAAYPSRTQKERLCILLEKEIAERTGEKPMYTGGDMRLVNSSNNFTRGKNKKEVA